MKSEMETFLDYYGTQRAENSVKGMESNLRHFSAFLEENGYEVDEVTWEELESYLSKMVDADYANATIRNRFFGISAFYRYAKKKDWVEKQPTELVNIGEFADNQTRREELGGTKSRKWLTYEELNQLAKNVPDPVVRNKCMVLMMYYSGCRRSELCDIELANMNFGERKASVTAQKTGRTITVRWQDSLDILLERWVHEFRPTYPTAQDSPYLFLTKKSERVNPNHFSRIVRDAAEEAGIQEELYVDKNGNTRRSITSHALRHSFGVHFIDNGGSIETLKEILAHQDIKTTQIYAELLEDKADEDYEKFAPSLDDTAEAEL